MYPAFSSEALMSARCQSSGGVDLQAVALILGLSLFLGCLKLICKTDSDKVTSFEHGFKKKMHLIENRLKKVMGDLSVRKFAEVLGCPPTTVQQYLKGRTPPADFVVLVCERFKVDSWWLLTGEGFVSEEPLEYNCKDPVTERIDLMLEEMDEEGKRDILKYAEEKKLLAELKAERQGKNKK